MALSIFKNISIENGFDESLFLKAKNILDKKQISYESLLNKLSKKKLELDQLILENKKINKELLNQKESIKGILHLEKERELSFFKNKLKKNLQKSEQLLEKIKSNDIRSKKVFFKESSEIKQELNEQTENHKIQTEEPAKNSFHRNISLEELYNNMILFSTTLKKKLKLFHGTVEKTLFSFSVTQSKCGFL